MSTMAEGIIRVLDKRVIELQAKYDELQAAANAIIQKWGDCAGWPDTTSDILELDEAIKQLEAITKLGDPS